MRITFIAPTADMSGGIKVLTIYAQRLQQMGHVVRVVSLPPPAIPRSRKFQSWLRGIGWPSDPPQPRSHLEDSGLEHRILDRWRAVTDQDVPDADVVIASWWETAEWVNELSPSKGAKVFFIQHHEIFPYLPVSRCQATYRLPIHKIVVAPWLKQIMSSQYNDNVVDLVPNCVDRAQFFAPVRGKQRLPTVGFLYSTAPFKGLDVSLEVLQIVRKRICDLRVISFGTCRPVPALPLPEEAKFFFSPAQNQIRDLYAMCDVWLTASLSEGFNLPAMEAMACRTPVVATRTGWPEQAVKSGMNGVLADVGDRIGLAQGAEWVLSRSDEDWRELSSNAFETVASSSWDVSAKMFESALKHACRRSARGEIAGHCAECGASE